MRKRDYRKEYDTYHATAEQKKNRASRNKVRGEALRSGTVKKGDKKEVDHKDGNPRNNSKGNLRVVSRTTNRKKQ